MANKTISRSNKAKSTLGPLDYKQHVQKFPTLGLYSFFTRPPKGFDFSGVRREKRLRGKRERVGGEHGNALLSCFKTVIYEN